MRSVRIGHVSVCPSPLHVNRYEPNHQHSASAKSRIIIFRSRHGRNARFVSTRGAVAADTCDRDDGLDGRISNGEERDGGDLDGEGRENKGSGKTVKFDNCSVGKGPVKRVKRMILLEPYSNAMFLAFRWIVIISEFLKP